MNRPANGKPTFAPPMLAHGRSEPLHRALLSPHLGGGHHRVAAASCHRDSSESRAQRVCASGEPTYNRITLTTIYQSAFRLPCQPKESRMRFATSTATAYSWLMERGRKKLLRYYPALLALLCVASCVTRPVDEPDPTQSGQTLSTFPQSVEKDVDLLFVIDNSESMKQEQVNLTTNFPRLIEALRSQSLDSDGTGAPCNESTKEGCNIPNVHIGVISTDLGSGPFDEQCEPVGGDQGRLQSRARVDGCTPPSAEFITYIDGATNIPGGGANPIQDVKDAFACIAELGILGCGFEHQLEAARRALDPARGINAGFLRDEALLAVVFITDEDDCSAQDANLFDPRIFEPDSSLGPPKSFRCFEFGIQCNSGGRATGTRENCVPAGNALYPIQDYLRFFQGLKPPGRVVLASIAGTIRQAGSVNQVEVGLDRDGHPTLQPSCQSPNGFADPAIRIKALMDAFAPDSQFSSICDGDFGPALERLGQKILGKLGAQCIPAPVLTPAGAVACRQGDTYGPGNSITCQQDCLDQVSCEVTEVTNPGTQNQRAEKIDKCPARLWHPTDWKTERDCGADCPCWRLVRKQSNRQTENCNPVQSGSRYGLDILRSVDPPKGTFAEARCLTAPYAWDSAELAALNQCQTEQP